MKPQPGLSKQISRESLGDVPVRISIMYSGALLKRFRMMERYGYTPYLKKL